MRHRTDKFIDLHECAYLELLIADKDPESRKIGLQRLCKLFRHGLSHRQPEPLRIFLMGLLHDEAPKVKRWALNALALAGNRSHVPAVVEAIQRNRHDPDIIGAGVSALCALLPADEARAQLQKVDLPIEGAVLLAAVQHSAHFQDELRVTRVNIDKASSAELRMAGILVGLNRAPKNLFSLSIPNENIIGELNHYRDAFVAQYSIWATYENPNLGLKNLRLRLHGVESKPANVRKHVYQLVAQDSQTAMENYDFLVVGSEDPSADARAGLATGLRDIYFDSLDSLVIDWYNDEDVDAVQQRLLEHMAANADRCPSYKVKVLKAYEAADANSIRSSPQRPSAALLQVASGLASQELMSQRPWEDMMSAALVKLGDKFARPTAEFDKIYIDGCVAEHPSDRGRRPNFPRVHSGAIATADTQERRNSR